MTNEEILSLTTINGGAVAEHFDNALKKVLENIYDINTTIEPREIIIRAIFKPMSDERRDMISFKVVPKVKLAGQEPIVGFADIKVEAGKLVATARPKEGTQLLPIGNVTAIGGKKVE